MEGREFLLSAEVKDQIMVSKKEANAYLDTYFKEIEEKTQNRPKIYTQLSSRKFKISDFIESAQTIERRRREETENELTALLIGSILLNIFLYWTICWISKIEKSTEVGWNWNDYLSKTKIELVKEYKWKRKETLSK